MPPKKSRKKASTASVSRTVTTTISVSEDDGTQVEKAESKVRRRAPATRKQRADKTKYDANLLEFCNFFLKIGCQKLMDQFNAIKMETQVAATNAHSAFDKNKERNRYKDVVCIDPTRVILKYPDEQQDYIHANYINYGEKGKFICTQGPMEGTVVDFWRMMWQEKCQSIIMLCNLMEQGKEKCKQYWPAAAAETMESGGLKITNKGMKECENVLMNTKLEVTDGKETRQVEHYQWNNWPDRGVPSNFLVTFRLLTRVGKLKPIVVHCSAGIGRTGTIVALDVIHNVLSEKCVTVEEVVRALRNERHGTVQMDIQYIYIHRVMLAIAENKKLVKGEEYDKFISEYDAECKKRGM